MSEELERIGKNRMGEPLEEVLRKRTDFIQKQKEWRAEIKNFLEVTDLTEEQKDVFDKLEELYLEYDAIYGDAAYQLGFEDGKVVGMEQKLEAKKTILSINDMMILISMHSAVQALYTVMNGEADIYETNKGIFGILNNVYDVIKNGVCQKMKLLGEEETYRRIDNILKDILTSTEDKAKMLLGLE